MRRAMLACVVLLLAATTASAQFPFRPVPFVGASPYFFGWGACSFGYSFGWGGFVPFYGAGFGFHPPTIVVIQPLVVPASPWFEFDRTQELARLLGRLPQAPPPLELALLRQPAAPAPRVARRAPKIAPEPPPKAPLLAPRAAADKPAEAERQIQLGRAAFQAGQPGRALERFEQALALVPERPAPYFLAAQAMMALARYREAAVAVLNGLKRQPLGPDPDLNPREMYGRDAGAHALDLDRLRKAVAAHPDEPALVFLYGYQLWINGRRDEARPHLERAADHATDPEPIRRLMGPADPGS